MRRAKAFVWILFFIVLGIRFYYLYTGYFNFSWDFARDMLWVRQLTEMHKPILVGPWGSLDGAYFGPGYYYLLAIAIVIFGKDPRVAVGMVALFLTMLIPLGYWFGRRTIGSVAGLWIAGLFAVLPIFTSLSLYSFSQHLVPLCYALFCISAFEYWKKRNPVVLGFSAALASFLFHLEPVNVLSAYIALAGIWMLSLRKLSRSQIFLSIFAGGVGILLPYLANIAFDLRHDLVQLHAFGRLFSGTDKSLHGSLDFFARLIDRSEKLVYWSLFSLFHIHVAVGGMLTTLMILFLVWKRKFVTKILHKESSILEFLLFFGWNLVAIFLSFLIFPRLLKDYYLYPLPVLLVFILGAFLGLLWKRGMFVRGMILGGVVIWMTFHVLTILAGSFYSVNGQTYAVQKKAIDRIYDEVKGRSFRVYTYSRLVYDFPQQYWFTWYGAEQYGFIPKEYAYLPGQPPYVLEKQRLDQNKVIPKDSRPIPTYLIVEEGNHPSYTKESWFGTFSTPAHLIKEFDQSLKVYQLVQEK